MQFINIKAFTIWELLISMLIAALLIGFTYGIYLTSTNKIKSEEYRSKAVADLIFFEKTLDTIIDNSKEIFREDNTIFFRSDNQLSAIDLNDNIIVFYSDLIHNPDTFQLAGKELQFMEALPYLINRIQLKIQINSDTFALQFEKKYSNRILYDLLIK